jgi:hypothetical protein
MKRGLTETAYQQDVEHCAAQGEKAMADYQQPPRVLAASIITLSSQIGFRRRLLNCG